MNSRLALIHKHARVWNTAPWVERLMWRQQEMHYMWNSEHAYDGGAFYRQMGLFTNRCNSERKLDMWGHYHPAAKERDENECRLFEMTKNIPNYGVGRLVYNTYETTYDSLNYERLQGTLKNKDGSTPPKLPDTLWLITRAWYDWCTPDTDDVTEQKHRGNFGYAYGLVFHYGETDGLEREFVNHNYSGWNIVPRDQEETFLSVDYEVHTPKKSDPVEVPSLLRERIKNAHAAENNISDRTFTTSAFIPKRTE